MIEINRRRRAHFISKNMYFLFIKQAIFFDPMAVILAVISKKVRAGLSARGLLGAPFGRKPLLHFLFYCWSLHPPSLHPPFFNFDHLLFEHLQFLFC